MPPRDKMKTWVRELIGYINYDTFSFFRENPNKKSPNPHIGKGEWDALIRVPRRINRRANFPELTAHNVCGKRLAKHAADRTIFVNAPDCLAQ
jgi:hypothetical protein